MSAESIEIREQMNYVTTQGRKINLVTNFRGVPIKLCVHIVRTMDVTNEVQLFVHHRQIISLQTDNQILLESDLFPRMVIATVSSVDLHCHMIRLGELAYVSGSMGQRRNMRVQPLIPIHIELQTENGYTIIGEVIDISLDGLSVSLNFSELPAADMVNPQANVQVTLGLPVTQGTDILDIHMPAQVAYLNPGCNGARCRLGLLTDPKPVALPILRRYIFDRQTEILDEIKQMNDALLEDVVD